MAGKKSEPGAVATGLLILSATMNSRKPAAVQQVGQGL
jgi:hypothetical protein